MKKKLFADDDFRIMVRKAFDRVMWYLKFDIGSKNLKKDIQELLNHMDDELAPEKPKRKKKSEPKDG